MTRKITKIYKDNCNFKGIIDINNIDRYYGQRYSYACTIKTGKRLERGERERERERERE